MWFEGQPEARVSAIFTDLSKLYFDKLLPISSILFSPTFHQRRNISVEQQSCHRLFEDRTAMLCRTGLLCFYIELKYFNTTVTLLGLLWRGYVEYLKKEMRETISCEFQKVLEQIIHFKVTVFNM
jgi:hypothetical protein